MASLMEEYLEQKDVVDRARKARYEAEDAYEKAEYNLSIECVILDQIASKIANSDDPIIKMIRELYQSGELK